MQDEEFYNGLPNWGIESDPSKATVENLEEWSKAAFIRKQRIEDLEKQIEAEKEPLNEILETIRRTLQHFGKDKYISGSGNIEIRKRDSVRTPKTEQEKHAFFTWLHDKGIFYEYATVNSNSLNALYKAEKENTKDGKPNIPGLSEPVEFQTVILKKG